MRLVTDQKLTPPEARSLLAGAVVAMRSYALLLEMNGFSSAADGLSDVAQMVGEAKTAWEAEAGGF